MFGNSKVFYLTILALVCMVVSDESVMKGGHRELTGIELEKAIEDLHTTLAKLAAGDGPSFKASKVTKVTTQVVAGTLVTYTAELTKENADKHCTIKVWSQPWLKENGTNVQITCEGDDSKLDRTW